MSAHVRRAVIFLVPFACLLVIAATSLLWLSELSGPLAIHWDVSGSADGFGSLWSVTVVAFVLAGVSGLGAVAAQQRVTGPAGPGLGALAVGLPLFVTTLHVGTLAANRAAGSASEVTLPVGALLLAVVALALGGLLGWWLLPAASGRAAATIVVDAVTVEPGEDVVWTGTAAAERWLLGLLVAIVAAGGVLLLVAEPWAAGVLVLTAVGVASLLRVRVLVGPAGVVARYGPFGLLRTSVPVAEVAEVEAEVVEPLAYGGWGYRLLPGVRAILVRRGPALRVVRRAGPTLVVTVDDAGVAAGVLRAHVAAQSGRG